MGVCVLVVGHVAGKGRGFPEAWRCLVKQEVAGQALDLARFPRFEVQDASFGA